jgi:protein transport protein SEC13
VYKTPSNLHTASVNSIAFAPHELGLILACASSDGTVSLLEHTPDGSWDTSKVCGVVRVLYGVVSVVTVLVCTLYRADGSSKNISNTSSCQSSRCYH